MEKHIINDIQYELIENVKEVFDVNEVRERWTKYFEPFDYILGDVSYGKIRLKGFYNSENKKKKEINDIKNKDAYLKDYCSFNCGYFLLKKIK